MYLTDSFNDFLQVQFNFTKNSVLSDKSTLETGLMQIEKEINILVDRCSQEYLKIISFFLTAQQYICLDEQQPGVFLFVCLFVCFFCILLTKTFCFITPGGEWTE